MSVGLAATALLMLCVPLTGEPKQAGAEQAERKLKLQSAVRLLDSDEPHQQDQAAEILGSLPPTEVGPALQGPLKSDRERVRRVALRLLRRTGYDLCQGRIQNLLRIDPEPKVRREACHALAQLHPGTAADALITAATHDRDVRVRRAATLDLGGLRTPEALLALIDQLEEHLERDDEYMAGITTRALTFCTGQTLGQNIEGWRHFAEGFGEDDQDE